MNNPPPTWTPEDANNASFIQNFLMEMGAYPFAPLDIINQETHYEIDEERRMTLHQWIDELSPINRAALFEITRLLVGLDTAV